MNDDFLGCTVSIHRPCLLPDFRVRTEDQAMASFIAEMYHPFASVDPEAGGDMAAGRSQPDAAPDRVAIAIDIAIEKAPHDLKGKDICMIRFPDRAPAFVKRDELLQSLENYFYTVTRAADGFCAIHASAVALGDRAFLLAGETMAGKSTLTAWLCGNGFSYITDDISLIRLESRQIFPHPNRIMLREGGLDVLRRHHMDLSGCRRLVWGTIDRFAHTPEKVVSVPCTPAGIFFLRRTEAENEVYTASDREAFLKLLRSVYVYRKPDQVYYQFLMDLAATGCYHLRYRDMSFVKDTLLLTERVGTSHENHSIHKEFGHVIHGVGRGRYGGF